MGYKRKVYKLKWPAGHDLHGLEVSTKGLSVQKTFELASLGAAMGQAEDTAANVKAYERLCAEFAARLVSWNLEEDDGAPVPATLEGILDQDQGLMLPLIMTWMDAVASVDTPLPKPSPNGPPPAAMAVLPMAPLSPNHPS